MFQRIVKFLGAGLLAIVPMVSAGTLVRDSEVDEITKEEVKQVLNNAEYSVESGCTLYEGGSMDSTFHIELTNADSLNVKGKDIKLTKAEFFVDNKLVETKYCDSIPFIVAFSYSSHNLHEYKLRLYGGTSPENETYGTYLHFD